MFMDVKAPITLRVASSWRSQSRSGIETVRISGKHKSGRSRCANGSPGIGCSCGLDSS